MDSTRSNSGETRLRLHTSLGSLPMFRQAGCAYCCSLHVFSAESVRWLNFQRSCANPPAGQTGANVSKASGAGKEGKKDECGVLEAKRSFGKESRDFSGVELRSVPDRLGEISSATVQGALPLPAAGSARSVSPSPVRLHRFSTAASPPFVQRSFLPADYNSGSTASRGREGRTPGDEVRLHWRERSKR